MKNTRKIIILSIMVLTLVIGSIVAYGVTEPRFNSMMGTDYETPFEILATLTGRTEASIFEEMQTERKSVYLIAEEAGVLDEFNALMAEERKEMIAERVADGYMTQEQADAMITYMDDNQNSYHGYGYGMMGQFQNNSFRSNTSESENSFGRGYGGVNGSSYGNGYGRGCH